MSAASRPGKKAKKGRQQGGFYEPPTASAHILSLSADGRRLNVASQHIHDQHLGPSEIHAQAAFPAEDLQQALDNNANPVAPIPEVIEGVEGVTVIAKPRAKRYPASDEPLRAWIPFRGEYLEEALRHEGRGLARNSSTCARCSEGTPTLRCLDCAGGEMLCNACMLAAHCRLPLHRIQEWEGTFFKKVSLRQLGQSIQPAHQDGSMCLTSRPGDEGLTLITVIHTNGLHLVNVRFCSCGPEERRTAFLRMSWWPATALEPRTCATFHVLRQFHLLNLQGNIAIYDFYRSLEIATDNTGLEDIPVGVYVAMTLMVRQWRHILLAKRAGRGHDCTGIGGTPQGGLAVECRACPKPGVNLPPGWEDAAVEDAWLYQLMISQDANFRLKNRLRTGSHEDPWLGPGLAYCVDEVPYGEYVVQFATQEDIRTCSGFAALLNALTRNAKGLRATGVISVSCRHELFLGKGMGDMQKGERWANIDYVLASAVKGTGVRRIMNSYDVGCEHEKGFFVRAQEFPELISLDLPRDAWVFVVPKFHVSAHKPECQGMFSPNYVPHAARFDGEHVERLWSFLNPSASSLKEMGPGARKETLDDLCAFNNWRKTVKFGEQLLRLMVEALPEATVHRNEFLAFDAKLRRERPNDVQQWEEMVLAWEHDRRGCPSPFTIQTRDVTRTEVRLRLLAEENLASVNDTAASLETGPSAFIVLGLDIRAAQYVERKETEQSDSAMLRINLQKRLAALLGKLRKFVQLQAVYMPRLLDPLSPPVGLTILDVDSFAVVLPSDVPTDRRLEVCGSHTKLPDMEDQLQYADACDALESLRHSLRMRTCYNQDKIANVTGQVPNTKARSLQESVDQAVKNAAARYRRAREAVQRLRGPGAWQESLRPLLDSDLIGLNERADGLEEGLVAYADEHAHMETQLADAFEVKWSLMRQKAEEYLAQTIAANRPAAAQNATASGEVRAGVVHVDIDVASEVGESDEDDD
ncbi:hypothetical protein K466DRAFT_503224 [Polyporus arcularius HHB13444]|uniref:CxC2-like cysteine cluster KDZ transposase-associated domain-containing protein n=1 Tax=Polyporus arcularius HHB13444 TaxID=1314778 RepID=A0A5C3NWB5_9APHY|nr:hypothetical protein K466DRAFT_503224 [Polyporus arcularius HHB13444]